MKTEQFQIMTTQEFARLMNVPIDRVKKQYKENAKQMRNIAKIAEAKGGKIYGESADYWNLKADQFEYLSNQ